jgi:hypothetical protein
VISVNYTLKSGKWEVDGISSILLLACFFVLFFYFKNIKNYYFHIFSYIKIILKNNKENF